MTLDNTILIAAYDPYDHRLEFDEPFSLPAGAHVARIEVTDRMGNGTSMAKTFHTSR